MILNLKRISVWLAGLCLLLAGPLARADEASKGFSYGVNLTTDTFRVESGGFRRANIVFSDLDLTAQWVGDNGWEAHGYILGNTGGGLSKRLAGDAQTVSNIDTSPAWRLFEAYVKHHTDDGRLITSFGLMNLNNVFDVQSYAKIFLNSSHGIGPDFSQTGPSIFPMSGLGTMLTYRPDVKDSVKFGIFDGVPGDPEHPDHFVSLKLSPHEGANLIAEYTRRFEGGRFSLDHWAYTAPAPRLDGHGLSRDNQGTYGQLAFTLTEEPQDIRQGLKAWIRVGGANPKLQKIDTYVGFGLYYDGAIPGRDKDQLGLALATAHFGAPYRAFSPDQGPFEQSIEMTYQAALNDRLTLQPDVQYILHPSGNLRLKNATVIGLRLAASLIP